MMPQVRSAQKEIEDSLVKAADRVEADVSDAFMFGMPSWFSP